MKEQGKGQAGMFKLLLAEELKVIKSFGAEEAD